MTNYKNALGALSKYAKAHGERLELYNVFTGHRKPVGYWFSHPPIADTHSPICEPHNGSGLYVYGKKVLSVQDPAEYKDF